MNRLVKSCAVFFLLTAAMPAGSLSAWAQPSPAAAKTNVTLLSQDEASTVLRFEFGKMNQRLVNTPAGEAWIISLEEGNEILKAGFPDLPEVTQSIIIPDEKEMKIEVTDFHFTEIKGMPVAPSKGNLKRNVDPASVAYEYNEVYEQDLFWPKSSALLEEPYILRDWRGQVVVVYPFQYNAKTKTLRIYSDLTVKISTTGASDRNVLSRSSPFTRAAADFNSIYQRHFINYTSGLRYEPLADRGNMLVISHPDFMNAMQPFVEWKNQSGIKTEMVDVSAIGNDAPSIKSFVSAYYQANGLTFLMLVGDHDQVVSGSTNAGVSDNDYGYLAGNDHYQEIFVGRFSAESVEEVKTQVDRTLEYEKNPGLSEYYSTSVHIASEFGAGIGDDDEADWEHQRNIRGDLLGYTYTNGLELYDEDHPGGTDAPGDPFPGDFSAAVNSGVGSINYSGHGGTTQIATTNFKVGDVQSLTNNHQWPFFWLVGCETGNFKDSLCFAEAWARATYEQQPAGAVASFMSTVNQAWAPPMEAQDEMNKILVESYAGNAPRSFGGISVNGCFSMNDQYGGEGFEVTDTWVLFGDPSLMIRTAMPTAMNVIHGALLYFGSSKFNVECDLEGAFVALSQNNILLGAAEVNGGLAEVVMNPVLSYDSVLITVTGFNKIPFTKKIPVGQYPGSLIVNTLYPVIDENGNGQADNGETIFLDLKVENVGAAPAANVVSALAISDPAITLNDALQEFGDLLPAASATAGNAFEFTIADDVADGHQVFLSISTTDDSQSTTVVSAAITINAPALSFGTFTIDEIFGNENGTLDPGESAYLAGFIRNNGHSDSEMANVLLECSSLFITIATASVAAGVIEAGDSAEVVFQISVAASAPPGIGVAFTASAVAGAYEASTGFIAVIAPAVEDFETGGFEEYDWELGGNAFWFTQSATVFQGAYSAQSGDIGDNQSVSLLLSMETGLADSISFYRKTSSEQAYDKLQFYVDSEIKGSWSGETPWIRSAYAVDTGWHTFQWIYVKDVSFTEGSDCGWIDNIFFPPLAGDLGVSLDPTETISFSGYPNPFDRFAFVEYTLQSSADVSIRLLDVLGRPVKTLLEYQPQSPGFYRYGFDAHGLPHGFFACEIRHNNQLHSIRLLHVGQ
jgi:hypothetical protein